MKCLVHDFATFPVSDLLNELPVYCLNCNMVQWGNGYLMSKETWDSFYREDGELVDPKVDPSANNPGWVGHK